MATSKWQEYETDNNHDGRVRQGCRTVRCSQRMDERNGIGGTFRCNRPDTPCRHTSRVQERSVDTLRGGKARQAAQRLLYGRVRIANGRGTGFPN